MPSAEDCFGVIFNLDVGSIALDLDNMVNDKYTTLEDMNIIVDETNEPIFILSKSGATRVSAEKYKEQYAKHFEAYIKKIRNKNTIKK
jgi:hypothetical protein